MSLDIHDGDQIINCVACAPGSAPCVMCGQIPYRLVAIRRKQDEQEDVFLCGKHYLEMLKLCPDLSRFENARRR